MITVTQASERMGVSRRQVLALIRAGRMVAVNISVNPDVPRYRLADDEPDRFLARNATTSSHRKLNPERRRRPAVAEQPDLESTTDGDELDIARELLARSA